MILQAEDISHGMNETSCDELLQCHLREPFYVHGISGHKLCKGLDLLRRAFRIVAEQSLCSLRVMDGCRLPAHRTPVRQFHRIRTGKILRDLRDDHIGLVDGDLVSDSQLQRTEDTDIVNARPGDCGPFQFHRIKDRNRIDQACPGRAPFDLPKVRHRLFILPFERQSVAGCLRRAAQGLPVCNIVIQGNQSV